MAYQRIKNPNNVDYTQWEYEDTPSDPSSERKNRAAWQAQANGFRMDGEKKIYFRILWKKNGLT